MFQNIFSDNSVNKMPAILFRWRSWRNIILENLSNDQMGRCAKVHSCVEKVSFFFAYRLHCYAAYIKPPAPRIAILLRNNFRWLLYSSAELLMMNQFMVKRRVNFLLDTIHVRTNFQEHILNYHCILFVSKLPFCLLVCDLNRTPIVMAKHGGSCVHFSGISTFGRTSRETVSHPQCPPLPTLCKISLPIYVIVTNKLLQLLTTTWYDSLVLSFSLLKI